ncbi:MAG: hypothetical protein LBK61_13370 [Spirochaetaceae bacterium]|nr:hypothetical protein [Spirochaetaceae bacterium]
MDWYNGPQITQINADYGARNLRETAPAGGENPTGFHPIVKPVPGSGRGISGRQAEYRHVAAVLPLRARNAAA